MSIKKKKLKNDQFFFDLLQAGKLRVSECGEVIEFFFNNKWIQKKIQLFKEPMAGLLYKRIHVEKHMPPRKNGKRRRKIYHIFVHRLAWMASSGLMPDGDINHIDHNPSNNHKNNLECLTHSQNVLASYQHRKKKEEYATDDSIF